MKLGQRFWVGLCSIGLIILMLGMSVGFLLAEQEQIVNYGNGCQLIYWCGELSHDTCGGSRH